MIYKEQQDIFVDAMVHQYELASGSLQALFLIPKLIGKVRHEEDIKRIDRLERILMSRYKPRKKRKRSKKYMLQYGWFDWLLREKTPEELRQRKLAKRKKILMEKFGPHLAAEQDWIAASTARRLSPLAEEASKAEAVTRVVDRPQTPFRVALREQRLKRAEAGFPEVGRPVRVATRKQRAEWEKDPRRTITPKRKLGESIQLKLEQFLRKNRLYGKSPSEIKAQLNRMSFDTVVRGYKLFKILAAKGAKSVGGSIIEGWLQAFKENLWEKEQRTLFANNSNVVRYADENLFTELLRAIAMSARNAKTEVLEKTLAKAHRMAMRVREIALKNMFMFWAGLIAGELMHRAASKQMVNVVTPEGKNLSRERRMMYAGPFLTMASSIIARLFPKAVAKKALWSKAISSGRAASVTRAAKTAQVRGVARAALRETKQKGIRGVKTGIATAGEVVRPHWKTFKWTHPHAGAILTKGGRAGRFIVKHPFATWIGAEVGLQALRKKKQRQLEDQYYPRYDLQREAFKRYAFYAPLTSWLKKAKKAYEGFIMKGSVGRGLVTATRGVGMIGRGAVKTVGGAMKATSRTMTPKGKILAGGLMVGGYAWGKRKGRQQGPRRPFFRGHLR